MAEFSYNLQSLMAVPTQSAVFSLVTSFYTASPIEELNNNLRIALKNLKNPYLAKLLVLLEGSRFELLSKLETILSKQVMQFENEGRLELRIIDSRPDYLSIFQAGSKLGTEYYAVANSDIFISEQMTVDLFQDLIKQEKQLVFALTRWNITPNGLFIQTNRGVPPWLEIPTDKIPYFIKNYLSFDVYFLKRNKTLPSLLSEIPIGSLGCDSAIAGLFKIDGNQVYNPCLSYRAQHEDNKIRDHTGQASFSQQENSSIVIRNALLNRFQYDDNMHVNLKDLEKVNYYRASIGRAYNRRGCWFNILCIVGTCPWQAKDSYLPVKFRRILVDEKTMVEQAENILRAVVLGVSSNDFIELEISGGRISEHRFLDMFLGAHPCLENAREILIVYDWQSVIYLDYATPEEKSLHDAALYALAEILGNSSPVNAHVLLKPHDDQISRFDLQKDTSKINLLSKSIRIIEGKLEISDFRCDKLPFLFRGIVMSTNVVENSGSFQLSAPHYEKWVAFIYDGVILPMDRVEATISFDINTSSTLFLMLCREGYTQFETDSKKVALESGQHSVILNHLFINTHPGIRIQIASMDHAVEITRVESSIKIQRRNQCITIGEKSFDIYKQIFSTEIEEPVKNRTEPAELKQPSSIKMVFRRLLDFFHFSSKKNTDNKVDDRK